MSLARHRSGQEELRSGKTCRLHPKSWHEAVNRHREYHRALPPLTVLALLAIVGRTMP